MDEREARRLVAEAGRMFRKEGLVARTWGNMSCRIDESTFAITPSGLGYESMTEDDVVLFHMADGTWSGTRKPSSEKGVHIAAYRQFPDVGFVAHTHQPFASALGLAGFDALSLAEEEHVALGGVACAHYGLPGSKRITANVSAALSTGAHAVLMAQHGALIAGKDLNDAFSRAKLLEAVCRRACKGQPGGSVLGEEGLNTLAKQLAGSFPCIGYTGAPAVQEAAKAEKPFFAQLDDMAQMIGPELLCVRMEPRAVLAALKKHSAVLVYDKNGGAGALCRADSTGDCEALKLLVEKACVGFLHTRALGVSAKLSALHAMLMHMVYKTKYAKQIGG